MLGGQHGEDQEQDPDQDQPSAAAAMEPMEEEVEVEQVVQPQPPVPGDVVSTPLCCFGLILTASPTVQCGAHLLF